MARKKKEMAVGEVAPEAPQAKVVTLGTARMPIHHVEVPEPQMGAKSWLIENKGIYVLERGPCVLRSLSCTYIGSGSFLVRDGMPDNFGKFDCDRLDPFSKEYTTANGRKVFLMAPQIIGFWGLDVGLRNGLTIIADGGQEHGPVLVTACWIKLKLRAPVVLETD